MNELSKQELWQALIEQGLVSSELPNHDVLPAPWYVRTMQGIAGWIGAFFIMGFFGAIFDDLIDDEVFALVLGMVLCVIAGFIFRLTRHNDFAQQFGLAVSFAGQGLFMFGLFDLFDHENQLAFFSLFIFQAILTLFLANSIHRVLTSLAAMTALMIFLHGIGIYGLISGITAMGFALIWSNEQNWTVHGFMLRPIGYGLALALLQFEVIHLLLGFDFGDWLHAEKTWMMLQAPLIGTALVAITFVWVIIRLLKKEQIDLNSHTALFALGAALLICLLSFVAKGMVTALLILLLGFNSQNRVLMGLGLCALLGFLARYYYLLEHTLLFKSIVLFLTGLVLLAIRFALHRCLYAENHHA
ncbi:hypothetical protein DOJK_01083 [Patescibacteria group bacterium]|nr:hypothetical protein DOJK_01083 [Patescibacteria group bacterium]